MANKKYLVVHPKLVMRDDEGKLSALKKGAEVSMESANAASLVEKGFLKLVVAKKKAPAKKKPKAKKSK